MLIEQSDKWPFFGDALIVHGDLDPNDTKRWGVNTYRVHALEKKDLALYDDGLVIARIDADRIELVQHAMRVGYVLCDTLTYWKGPITTPNIPLAPGYWSRPIEKNDRGTVERIAYFAFEGYPCHYSADKRLDKAKIPHAYAEWAVNGEGVLIEHERCEFPRVIRSPVAFGTFGKTCELVLAAVDKEHSGKGLYRHLVLECMRDGAKRGEKEIEISTQITNRSVQSVWASLGLRPHRYVHTLHWWPQ